MVQPDEPGTPVGREPAEDDDRLGSPVDVAENDSAYLVSAEFPQVKKKDTKVTIENGCLTISGERKKEAEE